MAKASAPTANGKDTASDSGSFRQTLDKPEAVASLSVAEASEIKERKRLIENEMLKFSDFQKIIALLRAEQTRYLQSLIQSKGLSLADDYNVDSDGGVIMLVARNIDPSTATDNAPMADAPKE